MRSQKANSLELIMAIIADRIALRIHTLQFSVKG